MQYRQFEMRLIKIDDEIRSQKVCFKSFQSLELDLVTKKVKHKSCKKLIKNYA